MIRLVLLFSALSVACADPQPCDTLCEISGFESVDEVEEAEGPSCQCGAPKIGATMTQQACDDYCAAGHSGEPTLRTTITTNDTCTCVQP